MTRFSDGCAVEFPRPGCSDVAASTRSSDPLLAPFYIVKMLEMPISTFPLVSLPAMPLTYELKVGKICRFLFLPRRHQLLCTSSLEWYALVR